MAALGTDLIGFTGARIEAVANREGERPREPHLAQETDWQQILERFRDYLGALARSAASSRCFAVSCSANKSVPACWPSPTASAG